MPYSLLPLLHLGWSDFNHLVAGAASGQAVRFSRYLSSFPRHFESLRQQLQIPFQVSELWLLEILAGSYSFNPLLSFTSSQFLTISLAANAADTAITARLLLPLPIRRFYPRRW